MKSPLILIFLWLFSYQVSAQNTSAKQQTAHKAAKRTVVVPPPLVAIDNALNYPGKRISVSGVVGDYKIIKPKLRRLFINDVAPYTIMLIFIKGNDIKLIPSKLQGARVVIRGKAYLLNGMPTITIGKPSELGYSSD
jgi:hypothetical protein